MRRLLRLLALCASLLGVNAAFARVPAAERVFAGEQLVLAQAIARGRVEDVRRLAATMGADALNRPGAQDMTLLFFALQHAFGEKADGLRILGALVEAGADPLQEVEGLGSVAGVAMRAKSPRYIDALLLAGLDPDAAEGGTPLLFDAVEAPSLEAVRLMLERGAAIDRHDTLGNTALMKALMSMRLDTVDFLLDRGADPQVVNINGVSFAGQLQFQIGRQSEGSPAQRKMHAIRDRLIARGQVWPPLSREAERERMRQRGQTPDALLPVR
ncbi:ankyrin repeat domain-containing protein [Lysobacter sp. 5GHs7-4]|uniref:ankyrin repeat domain-containing protein n=1 Tax=Lysobacter sp. 5GHs7-4 TaxID=2904253 RepID=UPI001E64B676|nr:ankyrin repeat domain-containing protein [Lysobacter sp. 5GHs7-4]UHQ21551.1 ankyrin repeat domain-containing protein [Lysobacter sp. 5GHs7-4]